MCVFMCIYLCVYVCRVWLEFCVCCSLHTAHQLLWCASGLCVHMPVCACLYLFTHFGLVFLFTVVVHSMSFAAFGCCIVLPVIQLPPHSNPKTPSMPFFPSDSLHATYLLLVLLSRRKDISLNNHSWLSDSRVGKLN